MGSAGAHHREQAGRGRLERRLPITVGHGKLQRGHAIVAVSRSERPSL